MLVFATLWPADLLLGLGTVNASAVLTHVGGAFGIATAVLAWYVSFAGTPHDTIGKALAPLVPFGSKVVDEPPHAMHHYQPVPRRPHSNRAVVRRHLRDAERAQASGTGKAPRGEGTVAAPPLGYGVSQP